MAKLGCWPLPQRNLVRRLVLLLVLVFVLGGATP